MYLVLLVVLACSAICQAGLGDTKTSNNKNLTEITRNKGKEDFSFPKQIRKYLRECGAEISDEEEEEGSDENQDNHENEDMKLGDVKKARKNKGTYPSSYGGGSDEDEDYDQPKRRKNKNKNNRMNNRKGGGNRNRGGNDDDDDYDESEECGNKNKKSNKNNRNRNDNRRGGGNKNRGNNRYGNRGGDDYTVYDPWGRYNFGGRLIKGENFHYFRKKREESEEETQCLPQCVFGYLNMLDDNRAPSETLVARYFQTNLPEGSEKMKYIRDVRKCFAKLASLDTEEGCYFSKELAKCMKLDMEGKIK